MSHEKEVERLIGICREHAKAALAKPATQREYFLRTCRNNWKRYAAGLSHRTGEWDRFAAALDRATRDFVALIEESGGIELQEDPQRLQFARDSVEGAMDSVITYEAAIEPVLPEPIEEKPPEAAATMQPDAAAEIPPEQEPAPMTALPPEPDVSEAAAAMEADKQTARYGFSANAPNPPPVEPPREVDSDLQRRVRELLRAHAAKSTDES
jgi:hypothetical protein